MASLNNTTDPYGTNVGNYSVDPTVNQMAQENLGEATAGQIFQNNADAYKSPALDADRNLVNNMAATPYGASNRYGSINTLQQFDPAAAVKLGASQQAQAMYGPSSMGFNNSTQTPQNQLLAAMQQRAMGSNNTPAQQQLAQGNNSALAQQMAVASTMQNGANAGLLQRQFAQGQADAGQNMAMTQQLVRAQDMQQGQQQQAQYLDAYRGQDIGMAQQNAQMQMQNAQTGQDMSQYNAGQHNQFSLSQADMDRQRMLTNAQLQNNSLDRSQQAQMANQAQMLHMQQERQGQKLAALGMNTSTDGTMLQSAMALDQARQNAQQTAIGTQAGLQIAQNQNQANAVGAGLSAAGSFAAQGMKSFNTPAATPAKA